MSVTSTQGRTPNEGCCFWIKNSDSCTQAKVAATVLVAALAAIAILGGVLLLLAQQGINLGNSLNTLAKMFEVRWVYIGLGVATGLLLVDTVIMIAMVRSYLDRSPHEPAEGSLQNERIYQYLESQMLKGEYWLYSEDDAHVVISKTIDGTIKRHSFKTEKEASLFAENSHKTNARVRIFDARCFIQYLASGIPEIEEKGIYWVIEHEAQGMAHLLAYAPRHNLIDKLIPLNQLGDKIRQLGSYSEFKEEEWFQTPITPADIDYLKKKNFFGKYINICERCLHAKEYVIREKSLYVALIIKHQNRMEVKFFKKGDPQIEEELAGPLKDYERRGKQPH